MENCYGVKNIMVAFDMLIKVDEMCKRYDRKGYPGIAIGVVENGELVFCKGYGVANLDYDIPIDGNTIFHACSIAKQFTATCIALLIEERKLSLDQDIRSIFPQLKDCGNKITISNLLHMTNGLPDVYDTANLVCGIRENTNINLDEFWKYVTACDWTFFKPGERWSYGNTGYFILGEIVKAVTKIPLSQYADEHIFKPLGMNNTFIRDDITKIIKNRAVGYSNYDHLHFNDRYERYCSRNDTLSINEDNVDVGGAGQLWTTVRDFYLWDKNFYNNILGKCSKELIEILTTSGVLNDGEECGYGYGLFLGELYGNRLVHHGGSAGGYSAYYTQLPEKKLSVIALGNHTNFYHDLDVCNKDGGLTHSILKLLIGNEDGRANKVEIGNEDGNESAEANIHDKINASKLKAYEGSYRCEKLGVTYNVKIDNDKLFISNENRQNSNLDLYYTPASRDTFISVPNKYIHYYCTTFSRDSNNEITSFSYRDDNETLQEKFVFVKRG